VTRLTQGTWWQKRVVNQAQRALDDHDARIGMVMVPDDAIAIRRQR
jgi:hypothetical protein